MTNVISILKDLCELASKGNELLSKHFPSSIQKEILRSAAQSGELHIIEPDQLDYPIVRAGGADMGDDTDPASLAEYYEAFKGLCKNGYIEHASGALFRLTAGGFAKARELN
jgi:hypothetical protein